VGEGAGPRRPGWADPYDALLRAQVLGAFRGDPRFEPLAILFKRVANILKAATETPGPIEAARLAEPAERALAGALDAARGATDPLWAARRYGDILPALLELETPIHTFFDDVLVNADDADLRRNRLRLLMGVRELFMRGWDLSRVVVQGDKS
jgi:glycyl-tRNA synthetase beta chain